MMRIVLSIAAFLVIASVSIAAESDRPKGKNCDLTTPPATAGEEINHGITLRIYPRAKDIDANYSGCQVLMAPDNDKWVVIALTEIADGDPVRIWSEHEKDPAKLGCRFKAGKVVKGNPTACPAPQFLLLKSMAPGCVATVREAVAKHGLGAPRSSECAYQ